MGKPGVVDKQEERRDENPNLDTLPTWAYYGIRKIKTLCSRLFLRGAPTPLNHSTTSCPTDLATSSRLGPACLSQEIDSTRAERKHQKPSKP